MARKIIEHFAETGETIERDMTEEEEAQAELDMQIFQIQEPVVEETPVADEPVVEGEQP